jgi:flagellin
MMTPRFISRRSAIELGNTTNSISKSFERLSTGLRINAASDDTAGLAITTRMTSQVEGLQQSIRNANDSISLFQTAEGALNEVSSMLQRARELSVQSANGIMSAADRESIQGEISQIQDEINHIASTTSFNKIQLFQGDAVERHFQIGANAGETNVVRIGRMDTKSLGRQARYTSVGGVDTAKGLDGLNQFEISRKDGNGTVQIAASTNDTDTKSVYSSKHLRNAFGFGPEGISAISKAAAINAVSEFTGVRAIVGETRTDNQQSVNDFAVAGGGAAIFGNTNAVQAVELTSNTYMELNGQKITDFTVENSDATGTLLENINAVHDETGVIGHLNENGELVLVAKDGRDISIAYHGDNAGADLEASVGLLAGLTGLQSYGGEITLQAEETFDIITDNTDINDALGAVISDQPFSSGTFVLGTNRENSLESVDVRTQAGAVKALDVIDLALEQVSAEQGKLGALQNRTESTISNLSQTAENLSAASSRIRDADFAQETASLASNQIKQQAAASMLAQVSQSGQIVLSLLQ